MRVVRSFLWVLLGFLATGVDVAHAGGGGGHASVPHVAWITFFVLLLLCIAVLPMFAEHWWESNANKGIVAAVLAVPVFGYYIATGPSHLLHPAQEYFSFIVLLWALFTISGGIVLKGNLRATPMVNTAFLAIGALIANIFGTTGAAMLLIRPLLRTNSERKFKKHIVIFFIFLVANIGGCLTPLGDPPLFLGFLQGVPFEWTLRLWPIWLTEIVILLVVFFVWDTIAYRKEHPDDVKFDNTHEIPLGIDGKLNFLWIAGVVAAILFSKPLFAFGKTIGIGWAGGSPWREIIMIAMGLCSMKFTAQTNRKANHFNFHPIIEVAVLFAGIFVTMVPALDWLRANGSALGVTKPWHFMWATGMLSSFLDNAPTYLVFLSTAEGIVGAGHHYTMAQFLAKPEFVALLKGISIGAVFMGANTYIGNAPNFMVKVIADTSPGNSRVKMPSFFGYFFYSVIILLPTFLVVTLLFF
ncbi:MAG: sodium:proton antiporter [Deltaproteobacteria bacterium]|nr:MAG: sodium:proton antiporter [Deltaproteobacteria bacterium]